MHKETPIYEIDGCELHDRRFNPWRTPATQKPTTIINDAVSAVLSREQRLGIRKRQRRAADRESFEKAVNAILSDVIHHHCSGDIGRLRVTRSKAVLGRKSRYRPKFMGERFPYILDQLVHCGYLDQRLGHKGTGKDDGRWTTIGPGPVLLERIIEKGISSADFTTDHGEEVLILKSGKEGFWGNKERMEYPDTAMTMRYRQEVTTINTWLEGADIDCPGHDDSDRRLRRIFSRGHFDSGGRLFGGFWQSMRKTERAEDLFIEGEPVLELDFDQMSMRILYGRVGLCPPRRDDLYAVPGYEGHRTGVKKLANAALCADHRLTRMPKGLRSLFGDGPRVDQVLTAIERHHEPIRHLFYIGIGHELQFLESQIMVGLLLRLRDCRLTALPIHDAILVAESRAAVAKKTMLTVFHDHIGQEGSVSIGRV